MGSYLSPRENRLQLGWARFRQFARARPERRGPRGVLPEPENRLGPPLNGHSAGETFACGRPDLHDLLSDTGKVRVSFLGERNKTSDSL